MKKLLILLSLLIAFLSLNACDLLAERQIKYDVQLRPVSEVEEFIADKLEVENPHLDLAVSIFEENED
jgi:hypothetical protein